MFGRILTQHGLVMYLCIGIKYSFMIEISGSRAGFSRWEAWAQLNKSWA